ncbi:MAG: HAD-IC family P-type ATPase [Oscillospiraceae bacterium]|nr:HAD-IC family P-type ATPase [Oscillospiraceae bacterium]
MLKDNVFVRKLVGIETAGSLNILFTDKTGTLTQGKLDVTHFASGSGTIWKRNEPQLKNTNLWKVLQTAVYYNNSATMNNNVAIGGNATDRSTLEFVSNRNVVGAHDCVQDSIMNPYDNSQQNITKIDIIPFSSESKFMATTVSGDWNATFIKGAPEKILPFCTQYYDENGNTHPFLSKSKIENILKEFAEKAIRIIAVAISDECHPESSLQSLTMKDLDSSQDSLRSNSQNDNTKNLPFQNLKFVGLIGIRDEIRKEVTNGIKEVRTAGIQTVMITGDSKLTAHAIAQEIGLVNKNSDLVITSDELNNLSDNEISNMLPHLRVIARALPSDKSRLVRIAQDKGLVVGMTGDGVNDAPALKRADVGFAMGSGTEIAKEASDIVILDNDFNSICKAICYGRTIFKSIRKFIIYQLSTCICAVSTTIIGSFIGVEAPITVIQMLWINIVMDTLAGLAFSGEKARQKYMQEPPKPRDESIINKYMRGQIAINSVYTTVLCLVFLKSSFIQNIFMSNGSAYMMTGFFTLFMFSAIFRGFCVRTHNINLFEYLSANKPFLWIMGIIGVVQIFIIYFGGTIFRTVGLDLKDTLLVGLIAFTIVPIDIIRKYYLMRKGELIGT